MMAGDWIKMRSDLAEDPAVIQICVETDLDEFAVVGRLHKLWAWADAHTTDGNAPSVTISWIDRYLCASGFATGMVKAGWLAVTEDGIKFPNFDRHNGQSAKKRAQTAKRVAIHKAAAASSGNAKGNAQGNAVSVTSALPREEKRRVREDTVLGSIDSEGGAGGNRSAAAVAAPLPALTEAAGPSERAPDESNGQPGPCDRWELEFRCLEGLKADDLKCDAALCSLHSKMNAEHPAQVRADETALLWIIAAAEHSIRHADDSPAGMFKGIVCNPSTRRAWIVADARSEARARLATHRSRIAAATHPFPESVPLCDRTKPQGSHTPGNANGRRDARELRFGTRLDGMTETELDALGSRKYVDSIALKLWRNAGRPRIGRHRDDLLHQLEKEQAPRDTS